MQRSLLLLSLVIAFASQSVAQQAPLPAFEAYSLHPLAPGAKPDSKAAFAVLDPSIPADEAAPSLLTADVTVEELLVSGYRIRNSGLLPGIEKQLPDWARTDEFHVSARLPAGATVGEMRLMLQALLRDRFAFASHEEENSSQVMLLDIDRKQPLKLVLHTQPCTKENRCGSHTAGANGALRISIDGETLDEIADELGGYAWYWAGLRDGPVVNGTSLQGRYDGTFTFTPIFKVDAESVTTLQNALRHDLGLTLQKGTHPVRLRIIDHVDRPAAD